MFKSYSKRIAKIYNILTEEALLQIDFGVKTSPRSSIRKHSLLDHPYRIKTWTWNPKP